MLFALAVGLKTTTHTSLPHQCKYRIGQLIGVPAADTVHALPNCHLWAYFSGLTWAFMTWAVLVASPYSSALHSSLARVQGYSLMVTTHNSTILKENGITEDVLFLVLVGSKKLCIRSLDTKSPCLYLQFLYPVTRHKEAYVYPHNFSVSFFFVLGNTPIPQPWWMPSNRQDLFFYWNFLSLWFFMVFVPFNKSIIIAMIIFIML